MSQQDQEIASITEERAPENSWSKPDALRNRLDQSRSQQKADAANAINQPQRCRRYSEIAYHIDDIKGGERRREEVEERERDYDHPQNWLIPDEIQTRAQIRSERG